MADNFVYNINRIKNGFILDVALTNGVGDSIYKIPDYEFIRQGIDLSKIKCVKVYNTGNISFIRIVSDVDEVQVPKLTGGVQPFNANRFIKIQAFYAPVYKTRAIFYYEDIGNYTVPVQDATLSNYME